MEDPAALAHLLAWPKLIQHFTFRRIHFNRAHWDLDIMQSLLSPYKSTLKTIAIGSLSGRAAGSINVSSFHELITLNLSRWQLDCTPEIACATLLAPKLHTFVWDFGIYDQHSEGWGHFAQPQADWILKFAQLAAARKSTLRIIEILFTPDQWSAPSTREQYEAVGYPWDRMDDLKISMKPLRIELKYSPGPSHTKEEVEKRIEEIEAEEAKKANVADIRRMLD
jgi:hypothetical protein